MKNTKRLIAASGLNTVDLIPALAVVTGKLELPIPTVLIRREKRDATQRVGHGRYVVHDNAADFILFRSDVREAGQVINGPGDVP